MVNVLNKQKSSCLQKVAKTDSAAATATRTEVKTRPATKIETTVPSSTPTTAKLKTANDSKKKEKKKPLCPYGTKCYRYMNTVFASTNNNMFTYYSN